MGYQAVATDFHNIFFPNYGSQWLLSTVWFLFCAQKKNGTHTESLEQLEGE